MNICAAFLFISPRFNDVLGLTEVIVIALESAAAAIHTALIQMNSSMRFDVVKIEDRLDMGTADSLRQIAPKIKVGQL